MSNNLNEKVSDLTIYNNIAAVLKTEKYYGYLSVKEYDPQDAGQRAGASKAFGYWFIKNCTDINFGKNDIKNYIVDFSSDQGIDAALGTSHNWQEYGCQDIWFYQFKFYESNVDDDAIDKMRELWNNVKKGVYGFSGDVYTKLKSLGIFDFLKVPNAKVHFIMAITTELDSSAQTKWNRLSQDIRISSLNYDLTLYDKNDLKKYLQ